MELGNNGAHRGVVQVNSLAATAPSYPVPGVAGLFSTLVAWQQTPGRRGRRRSGFGTSRGPRRSAPSRCCPRRPGRDRRGAWARGRGRRRRRRRGRVGAGKRRRTQIVVDQLYQPPGAASVSKTSPTRGARSRCSAGPRRRGRWGPFTYTVTLDGVQLGQTHGNSLRRPGRARAAGSHTWYVTASNPAGLTAGSKVGRVFVDTVPPVVKVTGPGAPPGHERRSVRVRTDDPAPRLGRRHGDDRWGDGTDTHVKLGTHRASTSTPGGPLQDHGHGRRPRRQQTR